ncbi:acyl carrier protein [Streptomyces sp. BR1]|uniref:acyl carrier protein n=1 Tax=Streptomyces sp. BR1 TaxID=1592323 RepID=UPI00402B6E15
MTTSELPPGAAPLAPPDQNPVPDEKIVLAEIAGLIVTVLGEYAPDPADIRPDTLFGDDLELESIDLVMLSGQLQEWYGDRVNFAEFVAGLEIDEVIALSVGRLVDHVVQCLSAGPVSDPGAVRWS